MHMIGLPLAIIQRDGPRTEAVPRPIGELPRGAIVRKEAWLFARLAVQSLVFLAALAGAAGMLAMLMRVG
jgi:hypothetical protein